MKTIKEILEENYITIGTQFKTPFYTGESSNGAETYPYRFAQNGTDDMIDYMIFGSDLIELKKFMMPSGSKEDFYNSLINNIEAYKDNISLANENQKLLLFDWKVMLDQLKTMVPDIKDSGGISAFPNLDYFKERFEARPRNLTDIRREFSTVLRGCIIHNHLEAERINVFLDDGHKIQCSKEFREYSQYIVNKSKGTNGKGGNGGNGKNPN